LYTWNENIFTPRVDGGKSPWLPIWISRGSNFRGFSLNIIRTASCKHGLQFRLQRTRKTSECLFYMSQELHVSYLKRILLPQVKVVFSEVIMAMINI